MASANRGAVFAFPGVKIGVVGDSTGLGAVT